MERRQFISTTAKYAALSMAGTSLLNHQLFSAGISPLGKNTAAIETVGGTSNSGSFQNVSTTVLLKGKAVKVHGLCTGTVAVKKSFKTKKGFGPMAKINILLERQFTHYLPIWVWVIEHPDGVIVIDTGEVEAINNTDKYLAKESNYNRYTFKHAARFNITSQDELNYQFDKIHLALNDVKLVALTHLHLDHTDGLKFFPGTEIIVGNHEYSHCKANMPTTYPAWFNPNKVDYKANQVEVFDRAYPINNDLYYVPTPGHTKGHSSVIFKTDNFDIIFAGDTSYTQEQVLSGELAGVNADFKQSKETYSKLTAYAANRSTIYLPSHDENAAWRLGNKIFLL